MAEAISLTDSELRAVMDAAAPLDPGQRDAFLHAVANALQGQVVGPRLVARLPGRPGRIPLEREVSTPTRDNSPADVSWEKWRGPVLLLGHFKSVAGHVFAAASGRSVPHSNARSIARQNFASIASS